ncbi:MAG TPA: hypothetical protein VGE45_00965 [Chloroflexia bacterium]|jgi:hypothetical protein
MIETTFAPPEGMNEESRLDFELTQEQRAKAVEYWLKPEALGYLIANYCTVTVSNKAPYESPVEIKMVIPKGQTIDRAALMGATFADDLPMKGFTMYGTEAELDEEGNAVLTAGLDTK